MRLIVTEKNNSAKKIAEILGGSPKEDKTYKVPYYTWSDDSGDALAKDQRSAIGKRFETSYLKFLKSKHSALRGMITQNHNIAGF